MGSPFKTPEFKKLFSEWNKKLVASGHKEIEKFDLEDPTLIVFERFLWCGDQQLRNESRLRYYEMAEVVLTRYPFKSKSHRRIWELHCRGISPRKISAELNRSISKTTIYTIISTIERETGLRREQNKDHAA